MWTTFTGPGGAPAANTQSTGVHGSGPGGWHPTILYLLALIVAEVIVAGWIIRFVK